MTPSTQRRGGPGHDDPLTAALAAEAALETAPERQARLAREEESRRVSDRIDLELEQEQKEKKRQAKSGKSELDVLLLGPSGAGKTTFLRQLRLTYDKAGLDAEREAMRLVILLSITRTLDVLLSLLEHNADSTQDPAQSKESAYAHRLRLSPLLGLEPELREALGGKAAEAGPTANSLIAHAGESQANKDGVQVLSWRDPIIGRSVESETSNGRPSTDTRSTSDERLSSPNNRLQQLRTRNSSPTTVDREPLFAPRFAERLGAVGFGNGKDAKRARAQAETGSNVGEDGSFQAGKDDPVHLLAALKDEVEAVWKDTVSAGLIAGEGVRQTTPGGFEMTESARYFLRALDRISKPDWLPNDDDLLNVRVRTLGIEHHYLDITPTQRYRMCDVAGARGVKHAWAPYFEGAASIIFVVATSDYNIADPDKPYMNRLNDALELFADVAKNALLKKATMIVFLNKSDVLRAKIRSGLYPVNKYLPAYTGGTKTAEVLSYVQQLFETRHAGTRKGPLYVFATVANDRRSILFTVSAINDILMRSTLAASGLL